MKPKNKKDKKPEKIKEFKMDDLSGVENPTRADLLNAIVHNAQGLPPVLLTGAAVTGITVLLVFGKVIVATTVLSGVAYVAAKITKRINIRRRKKQCSI